MAVTNFDAIGAANSDLTDNTYITDGPVTSNCSIVAGGYHKIGKLVIVNIRFTISSTSGVITGFPAYDTLANFNIVTCSVVQLNDSTHNNEAAYITKIGQLEIYKCTSGKTYGVTAAYLCN